MKCTRIINLVKATREEKRLFFSYFKSEPLSKYLSTAANNVNTSLEKKQHVKIKYAVLLCCDKYK